MGILPLQFLPGESAESIGIDGTEHFDLEQLALVGPGQQLTVTMHTSDGSLRRFSVLVRIDTSNELEYYQHGGILPFVLRQFLQ
jgi:aconitate hydratase